MRAKYEKYVYNGLYQVNYDHIRGFDDNTLLRFAKILYHLKSDFIGITDLKIMTEYINENIIKKVATVFLDVAIQLGEIDDFRGFMLECLGYGELDESHHNVYGPIKDIAAKALLEAGFATIYVARLQNSKGVENVLHKWYKDNAINIGIHAPLLTEAQYAILCKLLAENPDMSFKEILKDLAVNFDKYKNQEIFEKDDLSKAIALQEAFGITVDELGKIIISDNMELWWYNYLWSNSPEFLDGHTNRMYQQLIYNPH